MENQSISLSDGTKLCLECGLCCTGVFHDRALIYTEEDKACAKSFNATFVFRDEKEWFRLPCPVYEEKCTIYPNNPSVCQKHECDLLKNINSGNIKLEKAMSVVQEMKKHIDKIKNNMKSTLLETDNREITFLITRFFTTVPQEERKKFSSLLTEYATFLHLKNKYFYKTQK